MDAADPARPRWNPDPLYVAPAESSSEVVALRDQWQMQLGDRHRPAPPSEFSERGHYPWWIDNQHGDSLMVTPDDVARLMDLLADVPPAVPQRHDYRWIVLLVLVALIWRKRP